MLSRSTRRPDEGNPECRLERGHGVLGCTVLVAEDTGRFAAYVDLYINMADMQLTYDAMKIIGFNMDVMQAIAGEFAFLQELAHAGKVAQGRFIARRD